MGAQHPRGLLADGDALCHQISGRMITGFLGDFQTARAALTTASLPAARLASISSSKGTRGVALDGRLGVDGFSARREMSKRADPLSDQIQ